MAWVLGVQERCSLRVCWGGSSDCFASVLEAYSEIINGHNCMGMLQLESSWDTTRFSFARDKRLRATLKHLSLQLFRVYRMSSILKARGDIVTVVFGSFDYQVVDETSTALTLTPLCAAFLHGPDNLFVRGFPLVMIVIGCHDPLSAASASTRCLLPTRVTGRIKM